MARALLLLGALAFLAWEAMALVLWLGEAGAFGAALDRFWDALRSDWMLLVLVSDHLVIAGAALVLAWRDAGRRGWGVARRLAWSAAFVALGTPAALAYLALRPRTADAA